MSDTEIVCVGVLMSFVVAVGAFYLAEDEVERQWHERELKRLRKRGKNE
jgi:hypothetical protein